MEVFGFERWLKKREVAALAPRVAAEKYNLTVLAEAFEDEEAITTFFLIGMFWGARPILDFRNRGLFVFRTRHTPGALVDVLMPFKVRGINLFHVHSLYTSEGEYDFAIETECEKTAIQNHMRAVTEARKFVINSILFGPFPVLGV